MNKKQITKKIRIVLILFMASLAISGATAIPVEWELSHLLAFLVPDNRLVQLLNNVLQAVKETNGRFPFLMYGYDWLAFAHFIIAILFIGVIRNPVKNIWVVEFGLIACFLLIPFAIIFSAVRGLPFWWSLIDSGFGVFGMIPLFWVRNRILYLEKLEAEDKLNTIF